MFEQLKHQNKTGDIKELKILQGSLQSINSTLTQNKIEKDVISENLILAPRIPNVVDSSIIDLLDTSDKSLIGSKAYNSLQL